MTKQEALQNFFSGFEITAYPIGAVPEDTVFPWLTYDANIGNAGDGETSCTVDIWYHTESEAVPNAKVKEISEKIGLGGILLPYDGGAVWVKRGEPWCIPVVDDTDYSIKRRELNISLEFL